MRRSAAAASWVPSASTFALNNATHPFVLMLADKGHRRALAEDAHLRNGLNATRERGKLTNRAVAEALRLPCGPVDAVLGG